MAFVLRDLVRETSTTTGTGAMTLAGAVSGHRAFSTVMTSPSDTTWYCIRMGSSWEVGVGTYSALNTLTRTTVLDSSNAGAAVSFGSGTKDVFMDIPASKAKELQYLATGVLGAADGAVGAPSLSFAADPDTGFYRIGANNVGLALNGVKYGDFSTTLATFLQPSVAVDNATSPAFLVKLSGTIKTYFGVASAGNGIITGSSTNETCLASVNADQIRSVDNGATIHERLNASYLGVKGKLYVGAGTAIASPSGDLHVVTSVGAVGQAQLLLQGYDGGYGAGVKAQSLLGGGAQAEMGRLVWDAASSWSNGSSDTQSAAGRLYTAAYGTSRAALEVRAHSASPAIGGHVAPGTDNVSSSGTSGLRWTTVYATTGTINTSDAAEKLNVEAIPDVLLDAWGSVSAKQFQFEDSVRMKGAARARLHVGWMAQDLVEALEARGEDPWRFAPLCADEKFEVVKGLKTGRRPKTRMVTETVADVEMRDGVAVLVEREVEREVEVTSTVALHDASGAPVMVTVVEPVIVDGREVARAERSVQATAEVPEFEEFEQEVEDLKPTGTKRLGLRYEQSLVIESAFLRREIARLTARLEAAGIA